MKKILVTARSFANSPEATALLQQAGFQITGNPYGRALRESELLALIPGHHGYIAGLDEITAAVMTAGQPTLSIIAKYGVGYDNIDLQAAQRAGITVTNTPGANTRAVAELAFGLMLTATRHISHMDKLVRQGNWTRLTGTEVGDKTLGIIGLGSIGCELARRAIAFDMKVIAFDPFPRHDLASRYGITYLSLADVLNQADFISLHTPSTPETIGLINNATLSIMKTTAWLINTARGDLIVEDDLVEALEQGRITGAGLDVFTHEPVTNPRLLQLPNVVLTPHAGATTYEAITRMGVMAAEEIIRVLTGRPAINTVRDMTTGKK